MEEREDHEITLLAGKAAGLRLQWSDNCGDWSTGEPYGKDDRRWRPLHNNDDAFRLMVSLHIIPTVGNTFVEARRWTGGSGDSPALCQTEPLNEDAAAATRLAIVRVAASMAQTGLSADEVRQINYLLDIYR